MAKNKNKNGSFKFGRFLLFPLFYAIYHIIFSNFFPLDAETNTRHLPNAYFIIGLIWSAAWLIFFNNWGAIKSKRLSKKASDMDDKSVEDFKIPFSYTAKKELASDLVVDLDLNVKLANKSRNVALFVDWYDKALVDLQKLKMLEGKVKLNCENPTLAYYRLSNEFQWHLCDALERNKDEAIENINKKYRNSKEFQGKEARHFEYSIDKIKDRFSTETADFAYKALSEVKRAAGLSTYQETSYTTDSYADDLSIIDGMEGHDFEHWCADLLRKNGFTDVSVTQGSGDQGVDVLAKKDGIKYAVQCKCYSSDLGNTPVQEVHAGKAFYGCQVGAVMTNRHFTKGAQELAEKTGVLLWDRDKLAEMLNA